MGNDTIKINIDWFNDFLISIWVLINPRYWLMNNSYSKSWDKELIKLMDEHTFINQTEHTAQLGDKIIWIENHPYASFTDYSNSDLTRDYRPSRKTIYKAMQKLKKDRLIMTSGVNPCGEIPLQAMGGESMSYLSTARITMDRGVFNAKLTDVKTIYDNGIPSHWDEIND